MQAGTNPAVPFVVRGRRRNGTITYLCPDAAWALRKLADFERAGYTDRVVTGPDGETIREPTLMALAEAGPLPQDAEI